ncbi:acetyltransferase [Sphaerochaeta pleomorpha str. Grapes]|uniref:Acetyltransferase n=2 Tax=Sphaerochaeta TaxID=399320 RepID=G8QSJ0_SPHPG|nr:acetyltransferase [Sphaerochaeta pleomorpha str. Grapes]
MHLRLANMDDLPQLKAVYGEIVDTMHKNNIKIWDAIYPCEFFCNDIENTRLYVLEENEEIASAFALCTANAGADYVKWEDKQAKAVYVDRFGVNVKFSRKGIGSMMLKRAIALAREKGFAYVRLFVVDINEPAINLYIKNGFTRVDGIYDQIITDDITLHEFGFEIKTGL